MQKFRDYIYCDVSRMNSYINQIDELKKVETSNSYEQEANANAGFNVPIIGAGANVSEKRIVSYTISNSSLEDFVSWASNDKNLIVYDGEQITTDDIEKLIKLKGKATIPEMIENFDIINSVANDTNLFNMLLISDEDKQKMKFIKNSDNIPILLDADSDLMFSCNLKKDFIIGKEDDFVENFDDEISIIARVDKVYDSDKSVEIYDLIKEVFKLNRAIRRKIPADSLKNAIIYENGPLVKITPIVVYK